MTFPYSPQPVDPRPGPPGAGGYSPMRKLAEDDEWDDDVWPEDEQSAAPVLVNPAQPQGAVEAGGTGHGGTGDGGTGHPAVDAVLRSLANAARLAPADQIAEYEAAHRVLQETLATIDR